jgi:hypothetical protein
MSSCTARGNARNSLSAPFTHETIRFIVRLCAIQHGPQAPLICQSCQTDHYKGLGWLPYRTLSLSAAIALA